MKRYWLLLVLVSGILFSCNEGKVYQQYVDFEDRNWDINNKPRFDFTIDDVENNYNIYWNVRNSTHYPYARVFVNFTLRDSAGTTLYNKLLNDILFDPKSGKPSGKSGLGDLFDHRNNAMQNHKFPYRGRYSIELDQFMRTDTLSGVVSVGIEIEKIQQP